MSLINREALISYVDLCASCGEHNTAEDVIMMIKTAPTIDAVPVVRCKDCKYHEDEKIGMVYCQNAFGGWVWKNWFCADGERKEGAD